MSIMHEYKIINTVNGKKRGNILIVQIVFCFKNSIKLDKITLCTLLMNLLPSFFFQQQKKKTNKQKYNLQFIIPSSSIENSLVKCSFFLLFILNQNFHQMFHTPPYKSKIVYIVISLNQICIYLNYYHSFLSFFFFFQKLNFFVDAFLFVLVHSYEILQILFSLFYSLQSHISSTYEKIRNPFCLKCDI